MQRGEQFRFERKIPNRMVITHSFLSIKPNLRMEGGRLEISTPLLLRLLFFGTYRKRIVVDPEQRTFQFETQFLGKSRTRLVSFEEVERLDYSYSDNGLNSGSAWLGSHDMQECFTLKLILAKNREELLLGRFLGEGSIDHGWEGILAGDTFLDRRGDQEESSLELVRVLQAMTGLPLT